MLPALFEGARVTTHGDVPASAVNPGRKTLNVRNLLAGIAVAMSLAA